MAAGQICVAVSQSNGSLFVVLFVVRASSRGAGVLSTLTSVAVADRNNGSFGCLRA